MLLVCKYLQLRFGSEPPCPELAPLYSISGAYEFACVDMTSIVRTTVSNEISYLGNMSRLSCPPVGQRGVPV